MLLRRLAPHPTRDIDFGAHLQTFFISGVAMVLVIRTQLWLTNYPQLGGGGLHIAHLLWGGLFMAIAVGLLLIYRNRSTYSPAAFLGGIGFGFFIDELGKFITEDNDYFYQPAAALIYLIFVAIFLIIRGLERRRGLSEQEQVANAVAILSEAATGGLNERDRARALEMLNGADPDAPLVQAANAMLAEAAALPVPEPNRLQRLAMRVRDRYISLIERPGFTKLVCWGVGIWAVFTFLTVTLVILSLFISVDVDDFDGLSFVNWASLGSTTLSALFVLAGIRRLLVGDRVGAYRRFEQAFLIAIFITSVFSFYESQFGAVIGLAMNVTILFTFNRAAAAERAAQAEHRVGVRTDVVPDAAA